MDESGILDMYDRLAWKVKKTTGWIMTKCPFAKYTHQDGADQKPSFGISVHAGTESRYNCMACGKKGPLLTLPTSLEFGGLITADEALIMRSAIGKGESASESLLDEGYLVDRAPVIGEQVLSRFQKVRKSHLAVRGITADAAQEFELLWDRAENRLVFPIKDIEGRLVGLRGRFLEDADEAGVPRYKEYVELSPSHRSVKKFGVWFGSFLPKSPNKATILVEGEIDLIRLRQALPRANVLASIGATITNEQLRSLILPEKGLILFFDDDMAGKNACKTILREVKKQGKTTPLYRVTKFMGCNDVDQIVGKGGPPLLIEALQSLDKIH